MTSFGKYPAKSGQVEFAIGYSAVDRTCAQEADFAGISSGAPSLKRFMTEVSGRIRPNPASANVAGQNCGGAARTLNSHWNFSAARLEIAPNRPYPATGAYGGQ